MWSRKSRRKQRAALRKPVRCVNGAGRAPRGRAGVAPGQPQSGSLIGCVAERAVHWDACLASFALHVGNLCTFATVLWAVRAHTQRYARMHAVCRGSRLSRGARASRACDSACVLATAARMFRGGRVQSAELGSTFEPCHVSGCFEHAKTHRN